MREILFRGKSLEEDECIKKGAWIEGGLFIQEENDVKEFAAYILTPSLLRVANAHLVDPETVGQFTGLTDKNGKKVFEGDVLNFVWFSSFGVARDDRGVVRYDDEFCAFCVTSNAGGTWAWNEIEHADVIGNIHDDAYLLED